MADKRISARRGRTVNLDVSFYHNGVLADPYAIRKVDIYKTQVAPHNLVTTYIFLDPTELLYPSPAVKTATGRFYLPHEVEENADVPDIYFDVWSYYASNPCADDTDSTSPTVCDLNAHADQLLSNCFRFWVYPDNWAGFDNLSEIKFAFEPLTQRFQKPEVRALEVGLMPLPLYDFDYNLVAPIIPFLQATISIETRHRELLVDNAEMTIGIRQGSYRTNPFVLKYQFNSDSLLIGTYQYRVKITMPDGTTRVSPSFILTVA